MKQTRKDRRVYYGIYTLLFAVLMAWALGVLIMRGKSLLWNDDGLRQHYIALVYLGEWGREILKNFFVRHTFQIPLWDFHVGYGSDIITTFHYYAIGDPLNLFSIIVPPACTEYLYQALVVIRMYLAGLGFSYYCFEREKERAAVLAGAFSYVFCGYAIYAAMRHPFFLNPMIYLPMLLTGVERIFRRGRPVLFIFMVFLSAVSNFYCFYMIVFAVCFYVGVRFFTVRHKNLLKEMASVAGRLFGFSCIGVSMSAVILVPVLGQFFGTNRMDVKLLHETLYSPDYYKAFVTGVLTPVPRGIEDWTILGFLAPALLALFVLFGRRKQNGALKVSFLVLTGMLMIPFFGKALNGFSYVSNRWCWIYAALISYILVVVWQDLIAFEGNVAVFAGTGGFLYFVLSMAAGTGGKKALLLFALLLLLFALLPWFCKERKQRITSASCIVFAVLFLHICVNWHDFFIGGNRAAKLVDFGTALDKVTDTAPFAVRLAGMEEEAFFRYEMDDFAVVNSSALAGVNGLQYYWSLENGVIADYLMDMKMNRFRTFNYRDLDHRTFPDALAGVKYFVQGESDFLPFGYVFRDRISAVTKEYTLYENPYALPLGYTYKSYIPCESYRKMQPAQRQEALLQGVVFEEEGDVKEAFLQTEPVFTSQSVEYAVSCDKTIERKADGSFKVKKKGSGIRLSFSGREKSETYLMIRGADMTTGKTEDDEFVLSVSSDTSENLLRYNTRYNEYASGQKDFLVNLGYHDKALTAVSVRFPEKGTYRFDKIEVICQPMENYVSQAEALREYRLVDEQIEVNTVRGTINLPEDRILCLAIPYSKGWSARVDGVAQTLCRANVMYMALSLPAGAHTIELSYRTPGLGVGIMISTVGFLVFLFLALWKKEPAAELRGE